MKGGVGKKRIKKLCRDTAQIISDTCKGVVELVHFLFLQRNFKYVLLRKFSSDPLENQFGRFRQGCGSSYYLSVQQIVEKLNVYKSKLFLNKNKDAQSLEELPDPGHNCLKCEFQILLRYFLKSLIASQNHLIYFDVILKNTKNNNLTFSK